MHGSVLIASLKPKRMRARAQPGITDLPYLKTVAQPSRLVPIFRILTGLGVDVQRFLTLQ